MQNKNEKNLESCKFAVFYLRKSKRIETGMTFQTQYSKCYKEVIQFLKNNIEIIVFKEDNESGGNKNRPEYCEMKEFIKRNNCMLVCYSVDRVVRDVEEGLVLRKLLLSNKCDLYVYGRGRFPLETAQGKFDFISACNVAENQLNVNKTNQTDNIYEKIKRGVKSGCQPPYGYKSYTKEILMDKSIKNSTFYKPDEVEIYNVIRIYQLYEKYKSLSKVTKELIADNIAGKYGNKINKTTIASVLRNPVNVKTDENVVKFFKNKGFEIINVEFGKGATRFGQKSKAEFLEDDERKKYFFTLQHEGVIEASKWLKVQKILEENSKKAPRKGTSCKSVISYTIKCVCGENMKISTMKKDIYGKDIIYYSCKNNYGNKSVNGTILENQILNELIEISNVKLVNAMKKNIDNALLKSNISYAKLKKEVSILERSNSKFIKRLESLETSQEFRIDKIYEKIAETEKKNIR